MVRKRIHPIAKLIKVQVKELDKLYQHYHAIHRLTFGQHAPLKFYSFCYQYFMTIYARKAADIDVDVDVLPDNVIDKMMPVHIIAMYNA